MIRVGDGAPGLAADRGRQAPPEPAEGRGKAVARNSCWGTVSHVAQSVLVSVFFVMLARTYSVGEFADYIVVTALYQLVAAFSGMGLGQWFIRELAAGSGRRALIGRYLKLQLGLGMLFYALYVMLAFLLYPGGEIRLLALLYGPNLAIDNTINAVKCVNIADCRQNRTFVILTLDAGLRLAVGCLLFAHPFSLALLCVLLLAVRFLTLNLFLAFGTLGAVDLKSVLGVRVGPGSVGALIARHWVFVIIGAASIVNWRIANLIVSKALTAADVAVYEISYKLFSVAQILPVAVSASVFPALIGLYQDRDLQGFGAWLRKAHLCYLAFGLFSYTFVHSFADPLVPLLFGERYAGAAVCTRQIFWTILVFPAVFLRANAMVAMQQERYDMWFNVTTLAVNLAVCLSGLHYVKSLSVVNLAVFASFVVFALLQEAFLARLKLFPVKEMLMADAAVLVAAAAYVALSALVSRYLLFAAFWGGAACLARACGGAGCRAGSAAPGPTSRV